MLTSPERVQMNTLVSACQSDLGSLNDEMRITVRCLRMLPDSWVMIAKGGVVDKSKAFAPTYPLFVMRNSNLRSSFFCETKIVSVFFH